MVVLVEDQDDSRMLLRDISGKVLPNGTVADTASVALNRLRRDIENARWLEDRLYWRLIRLTAALEYFLITPAGALLRPEPNHGGAHDVRRGLQEARFVRPEVALRPAVRSEHSEGMPPRPPRGDGRDLGAVGLLPQGQRARHRCVERPDRE